MHFIYAHRRQSKANCVLFIVILGVIHKNHEQSVNEFVLHMKCLMSPPPIDLSLFIQIHRPTF